MNKIACIDLSEWQAKVDFRAFANSGIKAVILRAGYGRESSQKDEKFDSHYRNAKNAGLKVGIYWYSYADSVEDAAREVNACLTVLGNKKLDLPIFYDMEDNTQLYLGKTKLTQIAEKFCDTIKQKGYKAGVYANLNWFNNYLNYDKLKSKYYIWLAQYNSINELKCDIWQNSSTYRTSGYDGKLDSNIIFNDAVLGSSEAAVSAQKPTITYKVYSDGKWGKEIKGQGGVAGDFKQAISGIAIKVSNGKIRYRVHLRDRDWLPWVSGYNEKDSNNGYAGILGAVIDAIQVEFEGVSTFKATYRVCGQGNKNFYDWQHNSEKDNKQDGYAGLIGKAIDRIQITLT